VNRTAAAGFPSCAKSKMPIEHVTTNPTQIFVVIMNASLPM
jgi:hypothetical protein